MSERLFINGVWQKGQGVTMNSISPLTNDPVWSGCTASVGDVDQAMKAARAAFKPWARRTLQERIAIVQCYRDILEACKEDMARTIALETGKALWESRTEVATMIGKVALSIDSYDKRTGVTSKEMPGGVTAVVSHRPHGVVAVFGPYNFPGHLPNGHIIPAFLAGNTVVYKPSDLTPLVAERMTRFWEEAGLPEGVLNLVPGGRETGVALAGHEELDGLFFTGSSATGELLHKQFAGQTGKILALEMGGNNPLIVHGVKDLRAAAYNTIQSAFVTTGQRCTCARRLILVNGPEAEAFLEELQAQMDGISVGPDPEMLPGGSGEPPFIGPLVSNPAADAILKAQSDLVKKGAVVLREARRLDNDKPYLTPGLIDVSAVEDLPDEEHFGPLLKVIRVAGTDAALREANKTRYGLSAGLFSDDRTLWDDFLLESTAGIVNWNRPLTGASGAAPFGGTGASGNHRPSAFYAADYAAYPVATMQADSLVLPDSLAPGLTLPNSKA